MRTRPCLTPLLILLGLLAPLVAADGIAAGYQAWSQGRPADALPYLLEAAKSEQDWRLWYDAGQAAAASGESGLAGACLLRAYRHNPTTSQPLEAMRQLGLAVPATWTERLGLLAWPGNHWPGIILALAAGGAIGLAILRRRHRAWWVSGGLLLLSCLLPGMLLPFLSSGGDWEVVVQPSRLLDSTGAVQAGGHLDAGTLLIRRDDSLWAGRLWVLDPATGRSGRVPIADLQP